MQGNSEPSIGLIRSHAAGELVKPRVLLAVPGVLIALYGVYLAVTPVQFIANSCGEEGCIPLGPVSVLGLALGTPVIVLGLVAVAYGMAGRETKAPA